MLVVEAAVKTFNLWLAAAANTGKVVRVKLVDSELCGVPEFNAHINRWVLNGEYLGAATVGVFKAEDIEEIVDGG